MKRWAYLALILILTGCAKPPAAPAPEPTPPITGEAPAPSAPAIPAPQPLPPLQTLPDHAALAQLAGYFILDTQTGQLVQLPQSDLTSWAPNSHTLLQSSRAGLDRIDLTTGVAVRLIAADIGPTAWAPDGSRIAFTVTTPGALAMGVYLINRDGSGLQPVLEISGVWSLLWSPDGAHLAIIGPSQIRILRMTGAPPTEIATLEQIGSPGWSPDGRLLSQSGQDGTRLFDIAAGTVRDLPTQGYGAPHWSADSSRLIYLTRQADFDWSIWSVDLSGDGQPAPLGEVTGYVAELSPDRRNVAFLGDGCFGHDWDLYVLGLDGGRLRRLTSSPDELKLRPLWTPTGDSVIYATFGQILLVDIKAGETRLLIDVPDLKSVPMLGEWSPDGRYLAFASGFGKGIC